MLPSGITQLRPVHVDGRRIISEAVLDLNQECMRSTLIEVFPGVGVIRLADHHHPGDEAFEVLEGAAMLHTAPADDVDNVTSVGVVAGDHFVIPAGIVHTFMCAPGTKLKSTASGVFTEDWIIGCELNI